MKLLRFTKKLWENDSLRFIFLVFIIWRVSLFLILTAALLFVPLHSPNFLGGGFERYLENPYLFAWANFDGEHYLRIAQNGYQDLTHSFFPVYPLFISLGSFLSNDIGILTVMGLLISNISFLFALFLLWKLIRLDYSEKIARYSILSLVVFPTSFYFGSLYTGSLFFLILIASFYLIRTNKWYWAGLLGGIATGTRVNGVLLLPSFLLEWLLARRRPTLLPLLLIPLGLLLYMFYLYQTTGSLMAFYRELSVFGEQRQGNFVTLPQVFYRYLNILVTVDPKTTIYWTAITEFMSAVLIMTLLIYGFIKKMRPSYLLFGVMSLVLPALTGSFSSLPRYSLLIFPIFISLGIFLSTKSLFVKVFFYLSLGIFLIIETSLFLRGYWVS